MADGRNPFREGTNMELTLTQNSALYLLHNRTPEGGLPLLWRLGAKTSIRLPDLQRRRTFADAHASRRFYPANGR